MINLKCKKRKNELPIEHVTNNFVTCSNCGKKWELTPDLNAVKSNILVVQDGQIGVVSNFKED